ncbi:hypothetical protein DOE51_05925 [Bdellovibrio sp. NC01]|nr:hypothetical protein DOE51_05925 [Bdellovibrio sp. NC01]
MSVLCMQTKSCSSQTQEMRKLAVAQCEMQIQTLGCEELGRQFPEMKDSIRSCGFEDQCKAEEDYQNNEEIACLRGYKNSIVDTGKAMKDMAVSLGEFIDSSWESFKNSVKDRNQFIKQCNKSLSCKRDLVKDDHRYKNLSDEQLNKYSAAFLYVEAQDMKAWQASLDRAPGRMGVKAPTTPLTPAQIDKIADMKAMVREKIETEYRKFACYRPVVQAEMACYAIGNVIDPTLLFGAVFKGARLVGATAKAMTAEKIAARAEETEKAGAALRTAGLSRENLVKTYLEYSPTSVAQNEKWISVAEKGVASKTKFLDVENSQLKVLNDTLKDKNLVTSLTNYHKKILFDKIEDLKKQFPDLVIDSYSDFKSSRFAFSGKIPADLDKRLQAIFKDANKEFTDYVKSEKILREGDTAETWFRAGTGQSAEQANVAARYSRMAESNELQSYAQSKLNNDLTTKLNSIESSRQSLQTQLRNTSAVDGKTFDSDVFDIVRKNMGNDDKIKSALSQRYALSELSPATVKELQTYVKTSDEFSPGIFVPKREVAHLGEASQGGLSADVIGLGASNMKGTADALARSKNLDQVLEETRKAEKVVTANFQAQKKYFEDVVRQSVDPGKLKTVCSGDDCVAIAVKPLNETDKTKILSGLANSQYSGKFRLAFIEDGIADSTTRNMLSTHGESVEKLLRSSLGSVMEPRKLQGLTFGLDMRTQTLNSGAVKLLMGENTAVKLSTQERKLIEQKFSEALQDFNKSLQKQGINSNYRPF